MYGLDGENKIAVEVAMGVNDREINHVQDHLEKDWKTIVACRNQSVMKGLERKLEESDADSSEVLVTRYETLTAATLRLSPSRSLGRTVGMAAVRGTRLPIQRYLRSP